MECCRSESRNRNEGGKQTVVVCTRDPGNILQNLRSERSADMQRTIIVQVLPHYKNNL